MLQDSQAVAGSAIPGAQSVPRTGPSSAGVAGHLARQVLAQQQQQQQQQQHSVQQASFAPSTPGGPGGESSTALAVPGWLMCYILIYAHSELYI